MCLLLMVATGTNILTEQSNKKKWELEPATTILYKTSHYAYEIPNTWLVSQNTLSLLVLFIFLY